MQHGAHPIDPIALIVTSVLLVLGPQLSVYPWTERRTQLALKKKFAKLLPLGQSTSSKSRGQMN